MAMVNAKALKGTFKVFFKENGRDPDFNEFRKLLRGESTKDKKVVPNETKPKE